MQMPQAVVDLDLLRELRRQCLHHNAFPFDIADGLCTSTQVADALAPIFEQTHELIRCMEVADIKVLVNAMPAGYRTYVEPVETPLSEEYLTRLAYHCIAVELQKGFSPVKEVVQIKPETSEVLSTCPELADRFDDDGLLKLDGSVQLMGAGIRYRDYFLHYHQFLRRGFSSNPNFDFLGRLAHYRNQTDKHNKFRIAIDHRRIMKFDDFRVTMELDTWHGPSFDPAKLDDPKYIGLTVVGRSLPSPFNSSYALLKTEFLWKTNEGHDIKTLEIEELSSLDGSNDNWHINRYVHAERDMNAQTFRLFDGAAKVYAHHGYNNRINSTMPNNPRPNYYVKLFRIDGSIDLEPWLSLVSMFYKGNEMIVEYFDPATFAEKYRPKIAQWQTAMAGKLTNPDANRT
jgi:hypothetical protein